MLTRTSSILQGQKTLCLLVSHQDTRMWDPGDDWQVLGLSHRRIHAKQVLHAGSSIDLASDELRKGRIIINRTNYNGT
jgi:hypothetical protein